MDFARGIALFKGTCSKMVTLHLQKFIKNIRIFTLKKAIWPICSYFVWYLLVNRYKEEWQQKKIKYNNSVLIIFFCNYFCLYSMDLSIDLGLSKHV